VSPFIDLPAQQVVNYIFMPLFMLAEISPKCPSDVWASKYSDYFCEVTFPSGCKSNSTSIGHSAGRPTSCLPLP